MAPTMLHVGAFRDHPAAYLRQAFRSLVLPITASDLVQTMTTITFCAKAARGQLALAPLGAATMLNGQRFDRIQVSNQLVDLGATESAINPQHGV
jgi:hypothetical protein